MSSIQRISERKKRKLKFVRKQPKSNFNLSFPMISWQNKWLNKLIKMRLDKKRPTKWKNQKLLQKSKRKQSKKLR